MNVLLIFLLLQMQPRLFSVPPASSSPPTIPSASITLSQKRRIEQLTSVFENGTPQFDYGVVENLNDGRGYTAGRAGFTTATGDAYLVVKRYTEEFPLNPLAPYLTRLQRLANDEDGDTSTLSGFIDAWQDAAIDKRFQRVQDAVVDELYYRPAMTTGKTIGVTSALGRAILYDTIIQHGGGEDEDSLSALVRRTSQSLHGTPKTGVPETLWLATFLDLRRQNLLNPTNRTTQAVWAVSAGRLDIYHQLLSKKNLHLDGPIQINTKNYVATIL